MSSIGWVDFTAEDRRRVNVVLAHLKEPGTLDELGIGQVRDAFSDALFPGLSTIQTRARYFLAIPTIINSWAARTPAQRARLDLRTFLEREENQLAELLSGNHKREQMPLEDIIGHTRVGRGGVKRLPSSSYWSGLRTFRIVRTEKSLAEFCRSWEPPEPGVIASDEHGVDDGQDAARDEVEKPPQPDAPNLMTLKLNPSEAKYLVGRFCAVERPEISIVSQVLRSEMAREALRNKDSFRVLARWIARQSGIHADCKIMTANAAGFSLAVEGAHIAYNRLLADKLGHEVLLRTCNEAWKTWREEAAAARVFSSDALERWLCAAEELDVTVQSQTCEFLREWHERKPHLGDMTPGLLAFVARRAQSNKPGRSLLVRHPRIRSKWYGMRDLHYRWGVAVKMLNDLREAGVA